jgi:predicted RNA binding protein YcfA (HicA-like mRNA interferase family)
MAKRYPSKEAREMIRIARLLGFREAGYTGSRHPRLIHENGAKCSVAGSPGDSRNKVNAITTLERLSGRKLSDVLAVKRSG